MYWGADLAGDDEKRDRGRAPATTAGWVPSGAALAVVSFHAEPQAGLDPCEVEHRLVVATGCDDHELVVGAASAATDAVTVDVEVEALILGRQRIVGSIHAAAALAGAADHA